MYGGLTELLYHRGAFQIDAASELLRNQMVFLCVRQGPQFEHRSKPIHLPPC